MKQTERRSALLRMEGGDPEGNEMKGRTIKTWGGTRGTLKILEKVMACCRTFQRPPDQIWRSSLKKKVLSSTNKKGGGVPYIKNRERPVQREPSFIYSGG